MTSEVRHGKINIGVRVREVEDGPKVSTPRDGVRTPAMRERPTKPKSPQPEVGGSIKADTVLQNERKKTYEVTGSKLTKCDASA